MPKMSKTKPTADEIAAIASRGEDVSAYFTNKFTVVRPVQRLNVDLTHSGTKTPLARTLNEDRVTKPAPKKKAG